MTDPAPTILVVDDESRNRKLLRVLLEAEGYLTESAENGEEALQTVARSPPTLILLDVMMPGLNGYQVAAKLKTDPKTADIPIIMVSAHVDRDARLLGLQAGAEDFLTKPIDRSELWLRVRNHVRLKLLSDFQRNHNTILEQQVNERTAELAASELQFRQLAENIADVFFLRETSGGRILYISPAYENVWGRTRESLYVKPESWNEALHPDDREAVVREIRQGDATGHFQMQYRIAHPDGSIRWIEARGFPVRDQTGDVVRMAGIAKDITDRRNAEDALKSRTVELERFHRATVDRELRMIELKKLVRDLGGTVPPPVRDPGPPGRE